MPSEAAQMIICSTPQKSCCLLWCADKTPRDRGEPLTWVLEQLAGNGDPPPLTPRDPWENTTSNNTVGHVSQAQFGHDRRHLHRSQRLKVRWQRPAADCLYLILINGLISRFSFTRTIYICLDDSHVCSFPNLDTASLNCDWTVT